jgi:hypothetical protein
MECLDQQISLYGDLCGEATTYYDSQSAERNFHAGVECAIESAKICLEEK